MLGSAANPKFASPVGFAELNVTEVVVGVVGLKGEPEYDSGMSGSLVLKMTR
jgi:hypothetical protein